MKSIIDIAGDYNVILTEIKDGDGYCQSNGIDTYINSSYCTGHIGNTDSRDLPEIYLGIYEDQELRLISFFHELGHVTSDIKFDEGITKYDIERDAWIKGLRIAQTHGIYFSFKAKRWAVGELKTYEKYKHKKILNSEIFSIHLQRFNSEND